MRLLIPVVVFLSVFSLQAQTDPKLPPLIERTDVRRVSVDITVTDVEGRPITGLTPDDFEVLEDGQPRDITGFYAVEDAAVRLLRGGESESVDPAEFRRKFIIMIDNNTVMKPHRDAAIEVVGGFLDSRSIEQTEWAVITVGSQVETLQGFTTDKEAVRAALLKARRKPTFIQQHAIDRDLLSDPARAQLRQNSAATGYDFDQTAQFQSQEQTKRNLMAAMNSAKAVIQTCRAYSAATGKKSLILITGGIELNTSFSIVKEEEDRNLLDMKRTIEQMLNTMVREANASNVKIYVVKPGGHSGLTPQHDVSHKSAGLIGGTRRPFFGEGYTSMGDRSDVDSSSLTLALQTGGRFLPASQSAKSLDRIETDSANFYSVAFTPAAAEDAKYHTIKVRLKKGEGTVQHRLGYVALTEDQRLELALRAPITYEKEKGRLPVTLEIGLPEKGDGERRIVPISAAVDSATLTLVPEGDRRRGRVHVYLSIYDETGMNVGYHHRIQDVIIAAADQTPAAVRHDMKVGLKKGRFTIVVTMRDEMTDEIGTSLKEVRL